MIINKLNKETFYDFISEKLGVDVYLYEHDAQFKKSENGIKIKFYLGGEIDDERKFLFKDTKCLFKSSQVASETVDFSYDWVLHILEHADELTKVEKVQIVNEYNEGIEKDINNYTAQKRETKIV